jgi:hypothetical protein
MCKTVTKLTHVKVVLYKTHKKHSDHNAMLFVTNLLQLPEWTQGEQKKNETNGRNQHAVIKRDVQPLPSNPNKYSLFL